MPHGAPEAVGAFQACLDLRTDCKPPEGALSERPTQGGIPAARPPASGPGHPDTVSGRPTTRWVGYGPPSECRSGLLAMLGRLPARVEAEASMGFRRFWFGRSDHDTASRRPIGARLRRQQPSRSHSWRTHCATPVPREPAQAETRDCSPPRAFGGQQWARVRRGRSALICL